MQWQEKKKQTYNKRKTSSSLGQILSAFGVNSVRKTDETQPHYKPTARWSKSSSCTQVKVVAAFLRF